MKPVDSSTLQHISGALSAVGCFAVILTYYVFKDIRNLRYIELVFYVALNDLVASVGIALGKTDNGSFECYFQAIVTNAQYLSAAFWTTVISYQLWLAVKHSMTIKDMRLIHLICWILPIIITVLPLTTNTYGNTDDNLSWCFVTNTSYSPPDGVLAWEIAAFYVWIWASVAVSFVFIGSAWRHLRSIPQDTENAHKHTAATLIKVRRLVLYPVIVAVCWSLSTVADLYGSIYSHEMGTEEHLDGTATFLAVLQGLLFAITFFAVNPMIRHKWRALLWKYYVFVRSLFYTPEPTVDKDRSSLATADGDVSESGPRPSDCSIIESGVSDNGEDEHEHRNNNYHSNNNQRQQQQQHHSVNLRPKSMNHNTINNTINNTSTKGAAAEHAGYNLQDEPDYLPPEARMSLSLSVASLVRQRSHTNNAAAVSTASQHSQSVAQVELQTVHSPAGFGHFSLARSQSLQARPISSGSGGGNGTGGGVLTRGMSAGPTVVRNPIFSTNHASTSVHTDDVENSSRAVVEESVHQGRGGDDNEDEGSRGGGEGNSSRSISDGKTSSSNGSQQAQQVHVDVYSEQAPAGVHDQSSSPV